ncbi:MAG: cdd [Nitrososphaeraceae archaeon]|jgi:cytidine deaminase|nr:cdd [Nitrososphaeraceae archaeon]MCD6037651.1 cdd [Nitrososphaeraceae archaeon]MDF2768595.1 cdd [Nitrososphaeraceae archaeon]
MTTDQRERLFKASRRALLQSYSPYSKFKVGAALQATKAGAKKIFIGCNIENASYSLSICAERVALFRAVSDGYTAFKAIAISSTSDKPIFPCGACRQVLAEFCKLSSLTVYIDKDTSNYRLDELFPHPFKKEVPRS